jgi:hypothetical protein
VKVRLSTLLLIKTLTNWHVDIVNMVPVESARKQLLESSKISTLIEYAKFAVEEPDELDMHPNEDVADGGEACLILQSKIECLIALNSSLDRPAEDESDEEEARVGTIIQDRPAHQYFADLISARFPTADLQLVQSLGLSNWLRYNHVQQRRDDARIESDANPAEKAKSEFHDSGIGSAPSFVAPDQLNAQSVYAATLISSRAGSSHKRLPALPKEARDGKPVKCEICNQTVSIRRTKNWRYVSASPYRSLMNILTERQRACVQRHLCIHLCFPRVLNSWRVI